jgi:hypothetical protein
VAAAILRLQRLKPHVFEGPNGAAEQAAEKCAFRPSGVKTSEENIDFMSCLKAQPTKHRTFSGACEAAPHKHSCGLSASIEVFGVKVEAAPKALPREIKSWPEMCL